MQNKCDNWTRPAELNRQSNDIIITIIYDFHFAFYFVKQILTKTPKHGKCIKNIYHFQEMYKSSCIKY